MSEANIELICWYGVIGILYFFIYHLAKKNNIKSLKYIFFTLGWLAIGIIVLGLIYPSFNPF